MPCSPPPPAQQVLGFDGPACDSDAERREGDPQVEVYKLRLRPKKRLRAGRMTRSPFVRPTALDFHLLSCSRYPPPS